MNSKKNLMFFAFFFPVAFVVGLLISLAISLQFGEDVGVNWFVASAVAVALDLFVTWRNNRDEKKGG